MSRPSKQRRNRVKDNEWFRRHPPKQTLADSVHSQAAQENTKYEAYISDGRGSPMDCTPDYSQIQEAEDLARGLIDDIHPDISSDAQDSGSDSEIDNSTSTTASTSTTRSNSPDPELAPRLHCDSCPGLEGLQEEHVRDCGKPDCTPYSDSVGWKGWLWRRVWRHEKGGACDECLEAWFGSRRWKGEGKDGDRVEMEHGGADVDDEGDDSENKDEEGDEGGNENEDDGGEAEHLDVAGDEDSNDWDVEMTG